MNDPTSPAAVTPRPQITVTGPMKAKAYADDLTARTAALEVFGCLACSFRLWRENLRPLVGVTFLILFIQSLIGAIPIVGALSGLLLNGVYWGGLAYYYLGKMRGESREVSDAFAGFSKALGPLVLASLFIALLIIAVLAFILMTYQAVLPSGASAARVVLLLGVIPLVYLAVGWTFTFPLVIDKGLSPGTAMEVSRLVVTRQWFRVFLLMICACILGLLCVLPALGVLFTPLSGVLLKLTPILGTIFLGLLCVIPFISVLLALPLMLGAIFYAYEDLFSPPGPAVS